MDNSQETNIANTSVPLPLFTFRGESMTDPETDAGKSHARHLVQKVINLQQALRRNPNAVSNTVTGRNEANTPLDARVMMPPMDSPLNSASLVRDASLRQSDSNDSIFGSLKKMDAGNDLSVPYDPCDNESHQITVGDAYELMDMFAQEEPAQLLSIDATSDSSSIHDNEVQPKVTYGGNYRFPLSCCVCFDSISLTLLASCSADDQ